MNSLRNLGLLISLLLVGTFVACDGGCGSKDSIPAKPIDRVKNIGEQLPKSTEAVLFLSDLKATRTALNDVKSRLPNADVVESVQKQFQTNFGIDLLDRESWGRAGIAPDSSMAIAIHRSRVVAITYVEKKQLFEKTMTDKAKNAFQIEAVTKNQTVGGHSMKVLSDDPAKQIAWMYKGKMALVVLPATSSDGALEKGTASLILSSLASAEGETLAKSANFKSFVSDVADKFPASLFINPEAYVASSEFQKKAEQDPTLAAGAKWSNENIEYAGIGLRADQNNVELKALVGMQPELAKEALAAAKSAKSVDWSGYATDKVMLGIRTSVDWSKVWALFTKNLPDDERRSMLRQLKQTGQSLNLDLEKDVLEKLTGNAGVFFYGIGGGLSGAGANLASVLERAGLMLAFQFDSPESVQNLASKIMSRLAMMASLRPLQVDGEAIEDWKVIEFTGDDQPGRIYLHKDTVLFATTAFSEKSVLEYATNKRDEKRIKDVDRLDKGKAFAHDDAFTGIYFNAERAKDNLGSLLMMVPEARILNEIEEASLEFGVEKTGGYASLIIDLTAREGSEASESGEKATETDDESPADSK